MDKITQIYKELISEARYKGNMVYNGSGSGKMVLNDNPQLDYNMLGYGIYFTTSEDEAKYYAYGEDTKRSNPVLTTATFSGVIVDWGDKPDDGIVEKIKNIRNFNNYVEGEGDITIDNNNSYGNMFWEKMEEGSELYYYSFDSNEELNVTREYVISRIDALIPKNIYYTLNKFDYNKDFYQTDNYSEDIFSEFGSLYSFLYGYFNESLEKTSQYFVNELGIDGVSYDYSTADFGDDIVTYSIFNPNIINIINQINLK